MFQGFTQETSDFLWELQFHNERPWFQAHRAWYESALHEPFSALAEDTFALWREKYPQRQWTLHVARIYRDARRLFGRGPYKEHLWFSIQEETQMCGVPMFWFEIGAGDFARGMGFWSATPTEMEHYRRRVAANPAAFEQMIRTLTADGRFVTDAEQYRRKKCDYGDFLNPWVNCKRPGVLDRQPFGGEVLSPELPRVLTKDFVRLLPYYDYLRGCCEGKEPPRCE